MIRHLPLRLAAAFLAPLLILKPQPASAAGQAAAETRMDHISVAKFGSGPGIVFIPGLGSPRQSWDSVTTGLAAHHTVYLVQVNGFGGVPPGANLKPGILKGIVADLSLYLEREKAGPVSLVGHSMGGLAGMMLAAAHPGQVHRLMIVDALPYFPVLMARGGVDPTPAQVEPIAATMRDTVAARFGKPIDPATIKRDVDGLAVKPESRVQMAKWAAAADPRVTAQLLYEDMSTDLRPALAAMKLPITVVTPWSAAGFSKEQTGAFYRRQFSAAPEVTYVDIGDAGHFVMLDQPTAFRAALDAFLKP
jgi:pimeloyl-ACP methyl ester carboxylesterase